MPFNISQFKTQLERYGGPARTNLFDVQLLRLPTGIPVNENYDALRGINQCLVLLLIQRTQIM